MTTDTVPLPELENGHPIWDAIGLWATAEAGSPALNLSASVDAEIRKALRTYAAAVSDARTAALREENDKLTAALLDQSARDTLLTGLAARDGGTSIGLQGGAAALLAEMLAGQFRDGGGINYIELSFVSRAAVPGERFIVTVQRVAGKTPHALRQEAEESAAALSQRIAELEARGMADPWREEDITYPDHIEESVPDVGSRWAHSNGDTYVVIGYADMFSSSHQKTPPRVIYRSTTTGRVWSRVLSDWHRAMKFAPDASSIQAVKEPVNG